MAAQKIRHSKTTSNKLNYCKTRLLKFPKISQHDGRVKHCAYENGTVPDIVKVLGPECEIYLFVCLEVRKLKK